LNHRITPLAAGLYIVATPIGTARDITLRALDVLASADLLAAEDTRSLKRLLGLHGVPINGRDILSYHDHSGPGVRRRIREAVAAGRSVAYASEAGTPLISDPGHGLVREVIAGGCMVTAVPGPSAALAALSIAGLPTDRFLFVGFLPSKAAARRRAIADVADIPATLVVYESAARIQGTLDDLAQVAGETREAALCRELTKKFEEVRRAPLGALRDGIAADPPRGECVLVIAPPPPRQTSDDDIVAALAVQPAERSLRDRVDHVVAGTGARRQRVYKLALDEDRHDEQKNDGGPDQSSGR